MLAILTVKINHYYKIIKKFIYTKILRKHYYRVGSCKCCGECCQHIYVKHGKKVIDDEKLFNKLKYLHCFYTYLEVIGKDETGLIFSCTMQDPVTKMCKIHKKRPGICRRYPQEELFMMGGSLSDGCGYRLEPIITFNEIFDKLMKKS
ncbi:YkgJ family cysteine cluster protein [bacterium]|nr:YkgJ family cysteine cluster protein [bacterium]